MADLTPKQARFVAEYLIDLNATQAAIRAGYSRKTAEQQGCRLLRNAQVAALVAAKTAKQLEKADLTAARVLEELRRLGFSDLGTAFTADGGLMKLTDMPAEMRAAVASVKVAKKNLTAGDGKTEDVVEVRLWDKTRALESLAKHFGLLKETLDHQGEIRVRWAS
jgi:phage terminase small subunit